MDTAAVDDNFLRRASESGHKYEVTQFVSAQLTRVMSNFPVWVAEHIVTRL